MSENKLIKTIIAFGFILYFTGCALPNLSRFSVDNGDVEEIFRSASVLYLEWVDDDNPQPASYNIYYRDYLDEDWILLGNIPATDPTLEIDYSQFGDGSWVFGVSALDSQGNESKIHSSLDNTADPNTGWYLLWVD